MEETIYVIYRESFLQSIASDITTYGFMLLCMWYSYSSGGGWWTFFSSSLFIAVLGAKVVGHNARAPRLTSKKQAIEWANSLPDA